MSDDIIGKADGLLPTLLDLLPDYFYVTDSDMRMIYVNKTAADYFQLSKEEIVGKMLQDIEPDKDFAKKYGEFGRQILADALPSVSDVDPYHEPDGTISYHRRYDIPFRHPKTGEPLLMGMAQDVTAHVEREQQARRLAAMHREMEIAHEIQRSLFPRELQTGWLDLAGMSVPAAYAGGDFYDWIGALDGSVIITLGDVSGHGVGPALVAAECRAYWRVLAHTLPLQAAIERLNHLIRDDLPGDRFITLAAVKLYSDGTLEAFSAGHGPILLRRTDGVIEQLSPQTIPLGIDQDLGDEPLAIRDIGPGDLLLLFSDGITEASNSAGSPWQVAGLLDFLQRHRNLAGTELLLALDREYLAFTEGEPPQDDRTAVVATFGGQ